MNKLMTLKAILLVSILAFVCIVLVATVVLGPAQVEAQTPETGEVYPLLVWIEGHQNRDPELRMTIYPRQVVSAGTFGLYARRLSTFDENYACFVTHNNQGEDCLPLSNIGLISFNTALSR